MHELLVDRIWFSAFLLLRLLKRPDIPVQVWHQGLLPDKSVYVIICSSGIEFPRCCVISGSSLEMSPLSIITRRKFPATIKVKKNDRILLDGDKLLIGVKLALDLSSAKYWSVKPLIGDIDVDKVPNSESFLDQVDPFIEPETREWTANICKMDKSSSIKSLVGKLHQIITENVVTLIGAGPGATPLGDDILVGYIGTSKLLDIFKDPYVEKTILYNLKRTTKLSATNLFAANYGEIPETAVLLLKSLFEVEDRKTALNLVKKVCSLGQSTGQGLIIGIASYLLNYELTS